MLSENTALKISNLLNIDVKGYSYAINKSAIKHIIKRHGANGEHDSSLANIYDLSRAGYIINNFDKAEILRNEKGKLYIVLNL